MPNDPAQRLEWNEENFSKVIADLYREAASDPNLHRELLANPYELVNQRIIVPENYQGGILAREMNRDLIMLYVPPYEAAQETLPEGTTQAQPRPDYEPICTVFTEW